MEQDVDVLASFLSGAGARSLWGELLDITVGIRLSVKHIIWAFSADAFTLESTGIVNVTSLILGEEPITRHFILLSNLLFSTILQ